MDKENTHIDKFNKFDLSDNRDKVEMLVQIIEDFYINWKIGTLDNHLKNPERLKKITDIIYDKNREKNKGVF